MTSEAAKTRRYMPSKYHVKAWWIENHPEVILQKFDSIHEFQEADYCMACGMNVFDKPTERASG